MTLIPCPVCHGGRHEQFEDHKGFVVVRRCSLCRGEGEIIIKDHEE